MIDLQKKNEPQKNSKKIMDIAATLRNEKFNGPVSDTQGSYTGTPVDGDRPVQDADDL